MSTKQVYSIVGTNFCGPKAQVLIKALKPGADVVLVREPDNKFDKNAVAVWVDGERIGYVPKATNRALAAFIDQGGRDWPEPSPVHEPATALDAKAFPAEASFTIRKAIDGKFTLSPNSAFPQVEVG